jgi:hypothetical protein
LNRFFYFYNIGGQDGINVAKPPNFSLRPCAASSFDRSFLPSFLPSSLPETGKFVFSMRPCAARGKKNQMLAAATTTIKVSKFAHSVKLFVYVHVLSIFSFSIACTLLSR